MENDLVHCHLVNVTNGDWGEVDVRERRRCRVDRRHDRSLRELRRLKMA